MLFSPEFQILAVWSLRLRLMLLLLEKHQLKTRPPSTTENLETLRLLARKRAGDPDPLLDLLEALPPGREKLPQADRLAERNRLFDWYLGGEVLAPDAPGRIETLPGFVSKAGVPVDPIRYVTTEL